MHVVVTGASSGIGEAIAREYLNRGAKVTLIARRRDRLDKLAEGNESRAHVVQADLGNPEVAFSWLDAAEEAMGPIDVLVNNAGIQIVKSVLDTSWEDGERLLALDLHTPLRLTQLVLKRMVPRKSGTIVDIASMAALGPTPGMFFYNAAKAGLAAASEGLRAEMKPYGIHVVTVYPGPVTSDMEAAASRGVHGDGRHEVHADRHARGARADDRDRGRQEARARHLSAHVRAVASLPEHHALGDRRTHPAAEAARALTT